MTILNLHGIMSQNLRKGDRAMYSMEYFEVMERNLEDLQEWEDFEADLAENNPWDDEE